MGFLLVLILLVLVFGAGVALTIGLFGLLLTLVMAGIVGWAADALIPGGKLPGGWIGAVMTGLIGGFVGAWLFRAVGIHDPRFVLFDVDVIPSFVGAVIVALGAQLFTQRRPLV